MKWNQVTEVNHDQPAVVTERDARGMTIIHKGRISAINCGYGRQSTYLVVRGVKLMGMPEEAEVDILQSNLPNKV
jgi:hypothetical protein